MKDQNSHTGKRLKEFKVLIYGSLSAVCLLLLLSSFVERLMHNVSELAAGLQQVSHAKTRYYLDIGNTATTLSNALASSPNSLQISRQKQAIIDTVAKLDELHQQNIQRLEKHQISAHILQFVTQTDLSNTAQIDSSFETVVEICTQINQKAPLNLETDYYLFHQLQLLVSPRGELIHQLEQNSEQLNASHQAVKRYYWLFQQLTSVLIIAIIVIVNFFFIRPALRALSQQIQSDEFHARLMAEAAVTDELTQIRNRFGMRQSFASWAEQHGSDRVTCYLIDLNEFKPINDQYGHEVGDKILIEVAQRLSTLENTKRKVFRLGGDEFCLLVRGSSSRLQAKALSKQIEALIVEPIEVGVNIFHVHGSVGFSISPKSVNLGMATLSLLLTKADGAMYNDKRRKRSAYIA